MTAIPELMRIFDFTADDLEANRAGRLSERQAKTIKNESNADRLAVGCAINVGLLVVGLVGFFYLLHPQQLASENSLPPIIAIGIALLVLYLRYRSGQRYAQLDIEQRHAGKVVGTATWHMVIKQKIYIYQITVDGKVFRVEKRTYQAFETFMNLKNKFAIFRIYFAPETARILSIEII